MSDDSAKHAEREHAPYAPSSADIWMSCTAAVPTIERIRAKDPKLIKEQVQTEYTMFGTLCHEAAEMYLRTWKHVGTIDMTRSMGYTDAKGKEQTYVAQHDDMLPHVKGYVELVRSVYSEMELVYGEENVRLLVEEKVEIEGHQCWGSLDAAVLVPGEELHVFDLKTGSGKIVTVKGNRQFLCYATGLAKKHKYQFKKCVLHKYQHADPYDPCGSWECDMKTLRNHHKMVKAVINPDTEHFTCGDHCTWCPLLLNTLCPKQNESVLSVFADEDDNIPDDPDPKQKMIPREPAELTLKRREFLLRNRGVIRKFLDKLEAATIDDALAGNPIPDGIKVVEGKGRRSWIKDEKAIALALADDLAPEELFEQKLKPFSAVEKKIGKGKLDKLGLLREGGKKPCIVDADDPRPALTGADLFDDEKEEVEDLL